MIIHNQIIRVLILICMVGFCNAKTKFSDRDVAAMIPKYFARDHNSPSITRTRIYGENGKSFTLKYPGKS